MLSENALCLMILSILKNTNNCLGLYELMKSLEDAGYLIMVQGEGESKAAVENYNLKMFRKNFIVMNALYQLQNDLSGSGYYLFISALKIVILPEDGPDSRHLSEKLDNQATDQAMANYYLNWDNYHSIKQDEINHLLKGFWARFAEHNHKLNANDKRCDALQILGLESTADWDDIQRAYRLMIATNHPDRGGDSHHFIEIREAYLILKLIQN